MEMLLEKKISLVQIRSSKPWRFLNYEILKRSMLTLVYESYQIEVSELYAGPLLCAVRFKKKEINHRGSALPI